MDQQPQALGKVQEKRWPKRRLVSRTTRLKKLVALSHLPLASKRVAEAHQAPPSPRIDDARYLQSHSRITIRLKCLKCRKDHMRVSLPKERARNGHLGRNLTSLTPQRPRSPKHTLQRNCGSLLRKRRAESPAQSNRTLPNFPHSFRPLSHRHRVAPDFRACYLLHSLQRSKRSWPASRTDHRLVVVGQEKDCLPKNPIHMNIQEITPVLAHKRRSFLRNCGTGERTESVLKLCLNFLVKGNPICQIHRSARTPIVTKYPIPGIRE